MWKYRKIVSVCALYLSGQSAAAESHVVLPLRFLNHFALSESSSADPQAVKKQQKCEIH